eukprot:tig00000388_g24785.t1
MIGEGLHSESLYESLKNGAVLCNLINHIRPGYIRTIYQGTMPFKQENVERYLNACRDIGIPDFELFMTVDLYENKNMDAVVRNVHSLGRACQKLPGWTGPVLGVKMAARNPRQFSEEQLLKARMEPTFISKGSYGGATRSGNFEGHNRIVRSDAPGAPDVPRLQQQQQRW